MGKEIRTAVVLGAGLMGSQIAAHLANVGIPSVLLDIVPSELNPDESKKGLTLESKAVRNRLAIVAMKKLATMKPSPVYSKEALELITPGNLEDDLSKVSGADWVIEAVVENLAVKQALWQRVAAHWRPGTIVSSNTSGISVTQMVEGTPEEFRRYFLGMHFFNPPRYLKLLELIPTPETDPAILAQMKTFGERVLGKGIVIGKDTPNFIANRIGTHRMMMVLQVMQEMGLGPDDVDSMTGPLIGGASSATFRTLDVVGLDTFCHVADNCRATLTDPVEGAAFAIPEPMREMVRRGWLGQKSGQGFFKKEGNQISTLDLETMEYRPRRKASFPSIDAAKGLSDLEERLRVLVFAEDKAGRFLWEVMKRSLLYSAQKIGEIADDVVAVDNAMKWGFRNEIGPFEAWDALGISRVNQRMEAEGVTLPDWVKAAEKAGGFYRREPSASFYISTKGDFSSVPVNDRVIDIGSLRTQGKVVKAKKGASLIDMGDGVLLLELHSLKSAIGPDIQLMIKSAIDELTKGSWAGLVIGSRAEHFCVGLNLMLTLAEVMDEEWDEIEIMAKQGQDLFMGLKYCPKPVVIAPFGMTLGGGYELVAAADRVIASAETYMGLVEVAAGLIPGWGGTKEMLIRAYEGLPASGGGLGGAVQMAAGIALDLQPILNKVFETIGTAKVSTSGHEALGLGYLRRSDRIIVHPDHQLFEAKQTVLDLARAGYNPPQPSSIPVAGPAGRAVLELGIYNMKLSGYISEYDAHIGRKLAYVLTGGKVSGGTYITEQYMLDLEREAVLSLLGEKKTQERMQHLLKHGKPLRN